MAIHRITPGDILATRGQSWMSKQVLKTTGGPCTHVGLFLSAGEEPLIIEADTRVIIRHLRDSLRDANKAWVLHPIDLSQQQRIGIIRRACEFSGKRYGWLNILLHYLDATSETRFFSTHLSLRRYPICSEIVGWAYAKEGFYFGQAPQCLSPAEIFKFAKQRVEKYKIWEIQ